MRMQTLDNGQIMVTIKVSGVIFIAENQEEAIKKVWELSNENSKIN